MTFVSTSTLTITELVLDIKDYIRYRTEHKGLTGALTLTGLLLLLSAVLQFVDGFTEGTIEDGWITAVNTLGVSCVALLSAFLFSGAARRMSKTSGLLVLDGANLLLYTVAVTLMVAAPLFWMLEPLVTRML